MHALILGLVGREMSLDCVLGTCFGGYVWVFVDLAVWEFEWGFSRLTSCFPVPSGGFDLWFFGPMCLPLIDGGGGGWGSTVCAVLPFSFSFSMAAFHYCRFFSFYYCISDLTKCPAERHHGQKLMELST